MHTTGKEIKEFEKRRGRRSETYMASSSALQIAINFRRTMASHVIYGEMGECNEDDRSNPDRESVKLTNHLSLFSNMP